MIGLNTFVHARMRPGDPGDPGDTIGTLIETFLDVLVHAVTALTVCNVG